MASADLGDELLCSICLHIYTDPVMLRCGHNFCRACIDQVLKTKNTSGVYSCPECRIKFQKRPVLEKNFKLCNIVERFTSTQPRPEEVDMICCTYCIHSPVPALKSCLHCEASLCDNHLRVHSKSAEHILTEPTTSLENRKCSVHKKILEYYCTEDAACICVSCSLTGEHQGHQIQLLNEASVKKKEQLRKVLDNLSLKTEGNVSRVHTLCKHMTNVNDRAEFLSQNTVGLLTEIRRQVDDLEKMLLSEISRQKEQVSLSVSDLIQQLDTEKEDLSMTMFAITQMCAMTDPIIVLKDQELLESNIQEMATCTRDDIHTVGDLDILVMSNMIHTAMENIVEKIKFQGFNMPEASDVFLDINTAGNDVAVSEDLKTASWLGVSQNRPDTPETFQSCQVLSKSVFSSWKHFLEVESNDKGDWCVGMSYSSIDRKGEQCNIGHNDRSWGLQLWDNQYSVIHDSNVIPLPAQHSCKKLGLYLDYDAGQLSFYELCDPMRHLYTFTATFTEPLHVLCWVLGSSLRFRSGNNNN
ncbi:E3 ubiquitin-protein ligase TRIM39-like [Bufo gargarizans]|uniref:E3 ubiquitin-protein ligase TRIM39-like n=1 Tax=Bufo gargarizans TaxID=30331 RepID=UPI001CF3FB97|nr:E3 ubiquitin-protein ligase TRIM39-like [Bufo gargarizans]